MVLVGTNYHPHDWASERWIQDIRLMKDAGFNLVRLGHLCWDSFEPSEGNYNFEWFDVVMDMFADAEIKVVLDIATRPAPIWLHKKYPSIDITDRNGNSMHAVSRYMEDVGDPAFRDYAYQFAETLVNRYANHSALYAFGLCNEVGSGFPSLSEVARHRYLQWLRRKYGNIRELNSAWATQRWSRRLNNFEDVEFPVSGAVNGAPERILDMWRFFSDEQLTYLDGLSKVVRENAPNARETTNHWGEHSGLGFDYLKEYRKIFDLPGVGFYPGVNPEDRNALLGACFTMMHRIGEKHVPIWCLEFQTGSFGAYAPPKGALRMYAYLTLLYRSEAVCAWTWRTMLGGEEQYLYGLLDHDGLPGRKLDEFREFSKEMSELTSIGLPYLPNPEIGLAYSFESFKVSENQRAFYKTAYLEQVMQTFQALCEDNVDCNVVDLRSIERDYKLLLVPGHCVMDNASADSIRRFVQNGGVVIMTGYSAKVDEHNQVFGSSMPGRLADVFGIRANAFERPVYHYSDNNEGGLEKQKMNLRREYPQIRLGDQVLDFPIDYYEVLQPSTAEILAKFTKLQDGQDLPAVTENAYGKGRAIYVGVPAQCDLVQTLLTRYYAQLEIQRGPVTPTGVIAREVGNCVIYVNTTSSNQNVSIASPGHGLLTGRSYESNLQLNAYGVEVFRGDGEAN